MSNTGNRYTDRKTVAILKEADAAEAKVGRALPPAGDLAPEVLPPKSGDHRLPVPYVEATTGATLEYVGGPGAFAGAWTLSIGTAQSDPRVWTET